MNIHMRNQNTSHCVVGLPVATVEAADRQITQNHSAYTPANLVRVGWDLHLVVVMVEVADVMMIGVAHPRTETADPENQGPLPERRCHILRLALSA